MNQPEVSFIVPCYRLGHLLAECVQSILCQTYASFEIIIMDDCSPDDTPTVAQTLTDERIRYVRNAENLGHLANYNKGVTLSRGKYVWLISADDRLRAPCILERYVRVMEKHANVGCVCCPGIGLENGQETTLLDCGYFGPRDRIFKRRSFITASLRNGTGLLAPSVMVRKDCYDRIGAFPLDMPHQGDWYLWFKWALEYDVAYLAEPMVNYRSHPLNIMKDLMKNGDTVFRDEVNVLWRTKDDCQKKGYYGLADRCEDMLAAKYARSAASVMYTDLPSTWSMGVPQCLRALRIGSGTRLEYRRLRGKFLAYLGNQHWRHTAFGHARRAYRLALYSNWRMPQVWLKLTIITIGLGRTGAFLRKFKRGNDYEVFVARSG